MEDQSKVLEKKAVGEFLSDSNTLFVDEKELEELK